MPYYVSLFLLNDNTITAIPSQGQISVAEEEDDGSSVEGILQVFRIFKLARIFKLGRHSPGLQSIVHTIRQSLRELGLMLMLILIAGLTFASLCYFIEQENEEAGFTSIPTGEISSERQRNEIILHFRNLLGGDHHDYCGLRRYLPKIRTGKGDSAVSLSDPTSHSLFQIVGSMCAISGVLVMSLPIPIIAGNFEKFHKTQHKKNKLLKRRAAVVTARVQEEKERLAEICGGEKESLLLTPRPRLRSPVVSLLTTKTWSSRRNSADPSSKRLGVNYHSVSQTQ